MYLAHVTCGLSLTEVGQVFARDRTTVAHACSRVEDQRDDPAFDRALELLEGILRACCPRPPPFRIGFARGPEMPQARRAKKPPGADAATLAALSQLARKGAYAAPMDAAPGESGRSVSSAPAIRLACRRGPGGRPSPMLCRRGWLAADGADRSLSRHTRGHRRAAPCQAARRRPAKTHTAPPARQPKRAAKRQLAAERARAARARSCWLRRRKDKDGQPLITSRSSPPASAWPPTSGTRR